MKKLVLALCVISGFLYLASCGSDGNGADKVTISYNLNYTGALAAPATVQIDKGAAITQSNLPEVTRDGYDFLGWFTASTAGTKVTYSMTFSADAILYAQWEAEDDGSDNGDDSNGIEVKTGFVTFFNTSSYKVIIHRDAFSGPVLLELSAGSPATRIEVRTSDNYGVGTVFSIEYIIQITEGFDEDSGDVTASFIDPNVQINQVIEEGGRYTIQIPQPANPEPMSAFIRIRNAHNLQFELSYLGTVFKQAGNDNIPVPSGKNGIYKLEGIPAGGRLYQNYTVVTTFASTTIPDFTAENGFIYNFKYDGNSVTPDCSCDPCTCEECTCPGYRQPFIFN